MDGDYPVRPGHLHGVAWAVASVGDEVHATVAVPFAGVAHVAVAELTVSGVFFSNRASTPFHYLNGNNKVQ
jgi:hypothetical protein